MLKSKKICQAAILCFLVVLCSSAVYADWRDRFEPPKIVHLSEIVNNPEVWIDTPVRIPLRFSRIDNIFNNFFTRFNKERYINFAAWDTKEKIWEKDGFKRQYPFFYVGKDNPELNTIINLQTFDTICVLAKVDGIFRGKPYIRVVWAKKDPGRLTPFNLRLMNRGMHSFQNREFDKALKILSGVFATKPPADIQSLIYKTMAKIYMYDKQDYKKALNVMEVAKKLNPYDEELLSLYHSCKTFTQYGGAPPQPMFYNTNKTEEPDLKEISDQDKGKDSGKSEDNSEDKAVDPDATEDNPGIDDVADGPVFEEPEDIEGDGSEDDPFASEEDIPVESLEPVEEN